MKITMGYHFTPLRIDIKKRKEKKTTSIGKDAEKPEVGMLTGAGSWKTVQQFLK